ncbi:MAG TPA: chlorinating enzyme [Chthonomonadaceae bacterium]|nr:chlorinating enzyme [Chthonomonadaceae bacterium]
MDLQAEKEIFDEQGYIGPFKLWEPEVMTAWWKEQRMALLDPKNKERATFDNPANYDRHLDIPGLSRIITEPAIVRRFQALLGPDVVCWRTEFFPKNPGDSGTGWHQVETYSISDVPKGMLEPTSRSEGIPMELTAWVAFTEATKQNGCLKLLPGSQKTWHYDETKKMAWDNKKSNNNFFGYDYSTLLKDPNWNPDEQNVTHMEMKPGEFIIFTARCVHGSNPNTSNKQRMGFSIRVVPTHVKVYDGMKEFNEFGHHFDLARFGCVLIAGHDEYGFNRMKTENAWGEPFTPLSSDYASAK